MSVSKRSSDHAEAVQNGWNDCSRVGGGEGKATARTWDRGGMENYGWEKGSRQQRRGPNEGARSARRATA